MADGTVSADERLVVMLEARISEFEKRMIKAERTGTKTYNGLSRGSARATAQMEADMVRSTARINQALASTQARVGAFAGAFAGSLVGGAFAFFTSGLRDVIGAIADLKDTADQIGITTDAFQELRYGMKLAGVDAEQFGSSMLKFTENIGDAARGQGTFKDTLAANGIALRDISGNVKSTTELLSEFADMVKRAPNETARMSLITEAFGRGGKAMTLALADGSQGLRDMGIAAQDAGAIISEQAIAKAAELDDRFDSLTASVKGFAMESAVGLSMMVSDLGGMLASLSNFQGALDNIYGSTDRAAAILGQDVADKLAASNTLLEQNRGVIEASAVALDNLSASAGDAAGEIDSAATALYMVGNSDASNALSEIVRQMLALNRNFADGKISVENYKIGLQGLSDKARGVMVAVDGINGVDLSGAIGAADALGGVLAGLVAKAQAAAIAVHLALGMSAGGEAGAGASANASGSMTFGADGKMVKPKKPGGGGGGGAGGGGGNGHLDALLADLQTEREAVNAWYAESLQLLNGATEAQLAAVGGRHGALERLETEHQERMRGIRDQSQTGTLAHAETFFGAMATLTAAGGDKMAKAARATAAAEALINVYRAQAQVLADPRLGFWAKLPAMAAIGAAGMGLVSALGGGGKSKAGAASSSGGSGGGSAGAPTEQAQSPLFVTLQGLDPKSLYQGSQIIALANAMQKEFGRRGLQLGFSA